MIKNNKKSLVILYEIEHVENIVSYFGIEKLKEGSDFILVPIDYEIEIGLRARGLTFYSLTGHSAKSSSKERAILVSILMRQLHTDPEFNFFEYNGIRIGRIVGYSLGEYMLRILYHLDIFEFILDQFKNTAAVYMPESVIKLSSTVGQLAGFEIRAPMDTMAFLAQKRGIAFRVIQHPSSIIAEQKLRNFARLCVRNIFILSIKLLNSVISMFRTVKAMKIFVSDYWWHIDSFITKMSGVEITMMERKEIQNIRDCLWKYKIRFNHPSDYSTYFIKRHAEKKRQYYEQTWREFSEHPDFSEQFIWYGINFWEIVRPAYEHIITSFSGKVVEIIEATERLFKKQRIYTVILRASMSGQIHFPILGLVAHKMGIPAIELQHGLECPENFSLSARKCADIVASYGPLIKGELEKVNGASVQALNIGSPRFDQYRNETISEKNKSNIRKKFNIDTRHPVLLYVASDIVLGQVHDTYSMLQLFKNIAAATGRIKGLQVIVKIRPGPAKEDFFRQSLQEAFGEKCRIAQYENMHELISISNIVASSFSTVILEAMIARKPLVLVGLDRNDLMLMESHFLPYEKEGCVAIVRNKEDFVGQMRALLEPARAQEMIRKADNFLKRNFCFDGKSAARMANFLETLR